MLLKVLKMNLRNKSYFLVIFSILIYEVKSERVCCPNNGTIKSVGKCDDGSAINITCDRLYRMMLIPDLSTYYHFMINHDDRGEYLDAYVVGYSIYEPQ